MFRILSIDGGGIRGVFAAHILGCIEDQLGFVIRENIDLIAGTSTGAIIAAGIACGKSARKIERLYRECGSLIFGRPNGSIWPRFLKPAFHSIYENQPLISILEAEFGDKRLGDIDYPLLIPATDIGNGSVHVFKSGYSPDFTRDPNVFVKDAVLASCAAPTFFDPVRIGDYLLADGGIWANNPAVTAAVEAVRRFEVEITDLRVLSIGTGLNNNKYSLQTKDQWGLVKGWKHKKLIDLFMSLQSNTAQNQIQLLLQDDQLLRIDFEASDTMAMDDCRIIDDLISIADREFTHASKGLTAFLKE